MYIYIVVHINRWFSATWIMMIQAQHLRNCWLESEQLCEFIIYNHYHIYIYTIRVHRCMTILSHSRSHVSGVVNRGEKEVPGKHKENTGSSWGLHAVWVEQACCSPALSAMSAADANAAAAAAPPAAADRVAVLKEERKTLKRQLAAATKELQNQESACKCMDTVSFRECRWDMWTLNPCWKTCTP